MLHSLDEDDEDDDIQSNEVFETGRIAEIINQEREVIEISDDDSGSFTSEENKMNTDSDDEESVEDRQVKLNTTVHQLTTWYNPDPLKVHMENTEIAVIADEQMALTAGFTDGDDNSVNFAQVKNHKDKSEW